MDIIMKCVDVHTCKNAERCFVVAGSICTEWAQANRCLSHQQTGHKVVLGLTDGTIHIYDLKTATRLQVIKFVEAICSDCT